MGTHSAQFQYYPPNSVISHRESLKAKLSSWWAMDEAANSTRVDAHSGLDLIDNGGLGVGQRTGAIGVAADFLNTTYDGAGASNLYNSTADVKLGEGSFGVFGWFEPDVIDEWSYYVARTDNSGSSVSTEAWALGHCGSTGAPVQYKVFIRVVTGSGTDNILYSNYTPVVDVPYFVAAYYDYSNDEIGISIDGEAFQTQAMPGKCRTDGDIFNVGRRGYNSNRMYYHGLMNRVGITRIPLSIEEVQWLYNGGLGRTYAEVVA